MRWGKTELPPQAGVAVYVRGQSGKLAAARIYDDADPPLGPLSGAASRRGAAPRPAVEGRVVARVPGLAQPGRAEVPVGADLAASTARRSRQRSTNDGRPQNQ